MKPFRALLVLATLCVSAPAVSVPAVAGFELLRRETTDTRWKVLRTVERPGPVVLESTSTDNEFFAVRSVGGNGRRSIAVPCAPPARPAPAAPARPPGL